MTAPATAAEPLPSVDEVQRDWNELMSRVRVLEAEDEALQLENKTLRTLLERVIEHRQKSHNELVLLLTGLVSKLPINDVGAIISRLVEHNTNVTHTLAAFIKGTTEVNLPQPKVLKALDQTKRELSAAFKPIVEELIRLDSPFETELLQSLLTDPDAFFSPRMLRANRCFIKGQVARERIVRDFGDAALVFFNDVTTDAKLNPRPKPEEIALSFKPDFETSFAQQPDALPGKREELLALYQRVQRSKAATDAAREQKVAFQKLSFLSELLHYYENQSTEAPDVLFAQRLPALIEQLVLSGPSEVLDEKQILLAESLLDFVISPDHRLMIINNIGKGGSTAKTLKFVLRLRADKVPESEQGLLLPEFVKHLLPASPATIPTPEALGAILRLIHRDMQPLVVRGMMGSERVRKSEGEALGKALGTILGITGLDQPLHAPVALSVEMERQLAWGKIKELIMRRNEAVAIAAAIRERLHEKYDADEVRQSWITLVEADAISLIRIFCQIPYLASGKTDPIARTVLETYVTRLTHPKYAGTYSKVVNSLKNMFVAKPDSPTLVNFLALVRWVDPEAATKLASDVGIPPPHAPHAGGA